MFLLPIGTPSVSDKNLTYSVVSGKNLEHPGHPQPGEVVLSGKNYIVGNFLLFFSTGFD